jgi:hypothetical protein
MLVKFTRTRTPSEGGFHRQEITETMVTELPDGQPIPDGVTVAAENETAHDWQAEAPAKGQ